MYITDMLILYNQMASLSAFSHQYFIAGVRPEIKLGNKVSIPITAGMHLIRSGFYSERTLKGMFSNDDYYFQASPYVSAGIKIGF